jgi:hypothetical protein
MRRIRSLLFLLIGSLGIQVVAEDRLGLQVISDGIVTRAQRPEESYPDSDFRLNVQAALLASYRLTSSLIAFYEGRISHLRDSTTMTPVFSKP